MSLAARRVRPPRGAVAGGLAVVLLATGGCAGFEDRGTPPPSAGQSTAAPATVDAPPVEPTSSGYGEVPIAQGETWWVSDAGIYFGIERNGDAVVTARAGMGNPRCFYGEVNDGVLVGRYRAITAGSGVDRQAEPMLVTLTGSQLTFTERGTGTVLGDYSQVDPQAGESAEAAAAALAACREIRTVPATATPQ